MQKIQSIGFLGEKRLLGLLKKLVNKQVDEQVERFANEAKIPRALKDRIGVKIKWY